MRKALVYMIVLFIIAITLSPIITVVYQSFLEVDATTNSSHFTLANYVESIKRMNYGWELLNSIVITGISVIVVLLFSSLAAYPLARIRTGTSSSIYRLIVAGLVVPAQIIIIPIINVLKMFHIGLNEYTSILLFVTCSIPFSVFFYVEYIKMLPMEYDEMAFIDGIGILGRFFHIVFPVLKPANLAVIITQGTWIWNDYFFQMVFAKKSSQYTLPLGMLQFVGEKDNIYALNILFSSCVLSILPMLLFYLYFQRYLVETSVGNVLSGK